MLSDIAQETDQVRKTTEMSSKSQVPDNTVLIVKQESKLDDPVSTLKGRHAYHSKLCVSGFDEDDESLLDPDNYNQLMSTEKIIEKLLKKQEKYERDIKALNAENARLIDKSNKKKLQIHKNKIQTLYADLSSTNEFSQSEVEEANILHNPQGKKKK